MQKKVVNENTPEQVAQPFYKTPKFRKLIVAVVVAVGSYFGIEIYSPGSVESIIEAVTGLI